MRLHRPFHSALRETRASVAPLTALALVGLLGMGALTHDVSRAFALRTELASAADAAALASATQLDGTPGSRARSLVAAQSALAQNSQQAATVAGAITILPANVIWLSAVSPRTVATTDTTARFAEVSLSGLNVTKAFGGIVNSSGLIPVGARAVAGFTSAICKIPPLMICNPLEASGVMTFDGDAHIGKGIILKGSPSTGAWAPGNFGLLQVSSGSGANAIRDAMGRVNPRAECFGQSVDTSPGNKTSMRQGFNTRFDLFDGAMGSEKNDAQYQPALNTLAGLLEKTSQACNAAPPNAANSYKGCVTASTPTAMATPRDCCAYSPMPGGSSNCNGEGGTPLGNGSWDRATYFGVNHATFAWAQTPAYWDAYGPAPASGFRPTRYQTYRWETAILTGALSKPAGTFTKNQDAVSSAANIDQARPACYAGPAAVQQAPDRRTISAVVVNCAEQGVAGNTSDVQVIAYVDAFLTEPVATSGPETFIYGEILGTSTNTSTVGAETRNYWVRLNE
jgi:Flp pilus assembly protein TadG